MVLANEVNPVNRQYRELSGRYKAGWTFHRFLIGLRKFFGNQDLDDRTSDFRNLYERLRDVSLKLNDLDMPPVVEELSGLRSRLDSLIESLDEQDSKISPSLMRLFFQRVRTQDERILIELVRFYIEVQRGRDWTPERSDKVDFLLSRLGHGIADPVQGGDIERLSRVLAGISEYVEMPNSLDPKKIANRLKLIQAVRHEVEQVADFDALTERDLVGHYRNVKHGLGVMLFERSILSMVVSTNLVVTTRVKELTDRAQESIFEDYERVSGLEERGLLGSELAESVSKLHRQVGDFKKQIDSGTLRIAAIAEIRASVQGIFGSVGFDETADLEAELTRAAGLSADDVFQSNRESSLLGPIFDGLVESLQETYRSVGPTSGLDSRVLGYRLARREIEAFSRLVGSAERDAEVEQFLLAAVSLRYKIKQLVADLHGAGAETGGGGRRAVLVAAEECLEVADLYLRRFDHILEIKLLGGDAADVRGVQTSKMQLMREYSGLWLLVEEARS